MPDEEDRLLMAYTCPRCGRTSHHPEDEKYGYCGACHQFEEECPCPCHKMQLPHDLKCGECGQWVRAGESATPAT